MSLTEGHTVWVHNKLVVGTWASVTAVDDLEHQNRIDQKWSEAHQGFHLAIPDNYTTIAVGTFMVPLMIGAYTLVNNNEK
ncbi:hypothetical protein C1646_762238 [Rhizophagus diaphanus]|nr:hypothetical protein C1646_762238 [Rhizophagus diaphanus] [Rhizophagus sp. MUCL 43196]